MIAHNATHTHAEKKTSFNAMLQQVTTNNSQSEISMTKKAPSSAYNSLVAKPLGCIKYYSKVVRTGVTRQDLHRATQLTFPGQLFTACLQLVFSERLSLQISGSTVVIFTAGQQSPVQMTVEKNTTEVIILFFNLTNIEIRELLLIASILQIHELLLVALILFPNPPSPRAQSCTTKLQNTQHMQDSNLCI